MPFEIVRNDIVNMHVDAIVNTANPWPVVGTGTDCAIHAKAGPELLRAREKIGRISVGCSAITPGYGLDAKYVIHTVGPIWRGGLFGEEKKLRACYDSALKLAAEQGCRSMAFPLIATGNYGFPRDRALQIAIAAFSAFLTEHEMRICLVVWDTDSFRLSEKLFSNIASYIDEHYIQQQEARGYGKRAASICRPSEQRRRMQKERDALLPGCEAAEEAAVCYCAPMAMPAKPLSLEEMLKQEDAGFSETLLKLIDKTGKKDAQVYKKANISKQHFSKIRNNPDYKPTKQTAVALALALELDLNETRDLIGRAGYALSNSSKFDLIIRYYIEQRNYNVVEINMALYEFDQSLLGS